MNNILITGGAGFIASHVTALFVRKYPQYKVGTHGFQFPFFVGCRASKSSFFKIISLPIGRGSGQSGLLRQPQELELRRLQSKFQICERRRRLC